MEQPIIDGTAMVYHETRSSRRNIDDPEKGRLLFAGSCEFIAAANNMKLLPPAVLPEVCFAGRSNVGKSSLVNALTGRRMLARTSQTPGRTRQLIFFNLANRLQLVDLPGYGYAVAPKTDIKAWTMLTHKFLAARPSLKRIFLLIDSRRGVGPLDEDIMQLLDKTAVSWAVVMTKTDKLKPAQIDKTLEDTHSKISRHVAAYPEIFVTSSETKEGIEYLRTHMADFATPKSIHPSNPHPAGN
ncbi:MAG: ribosome biogenesis GTP-binding protein YihA/YsxC [Pseudomonadota bacterium]|jgi:GTP-binding protein|nr:ribosome biogenesis GTP-binding protein YihA/YsxC [Pseudomonadota bacterium]